MKTTSLLLKLSTSLVCAIAIAGASAFGANSTFTNTTTGAQNWSTAANWGGTVADGAGNTAFVNPASPGTTLTLDLAVTIGTINAPSANFNNIITGSNTLTMNGTGGTN